MASSVKCHKVNLGNFDQNKLNALQTINSGSLEPSGIVPQVFVLHKQNTCGTSCILTA